MPFTRTWDETDPSTSDNASAGAQEIREFKTDFKERMGLEHMYGTLTNSPFGMHMWAVKKIVFSDSPYTVTDLDHILLCDCTNGEITLNLPVVASRQGKPYVIIKTDTTTNAIVLDGSTTEPVGGQLTQKITNPHQGVMIYAESLVATGWQMIAWDRKLQLLNHGSKTGNYTIELSLAMVHIVEFTNTAILTITDALLLDRAMVIVKNNNYVITLSGIDNSSPTLTQAASTQDFLALIKSFGRISCVGFENSYVTS